MKKINYRHYICLFITLLLLFITYIYFKYGYIRFYESFLDLFNSLKYYFSNLFKIDLHGKITVLDFTNAPYKLPWNLPNNWNEFKILLNLFLKTFFTWNNFKLYLFAVLDFFYYLSKIILLLIPIIFVLLLLYKKNRSKSNNDYGIDSVHLYRFKWIENNVFIPINKWIKSFIQFVKENPLYAKLWLLIWIYNCNIIPIIISFFAYYFYFISAFDLISLYTQLLKLLYDLSPIISFIPNFLWIILFYVLFNYLCFAKANKTQKKLEYRNQMFINDRSFVSMPVGTMGISKTASITDMALSTEFIFRNQALKFMMDINLEFPNFPWIKFELDLQHAINKHTVYSLATCVRFINSKYRRFIQQNKIKNKRFTLYGYDYDKYGLKFIDGLKVVDLFSALEDYCKCYFIYITESSLIVSNYSIRSSGQLISLNNFPLWNCDFFKEDPKYSKVISNYSHILDFDACRLGKLVKPNNPYAHFLEFGVINITEVGKERGNQLENMNFKISDDESNPKNDGFNKFLKMIRHRSTIRGFCFIRIFMDENRADSLGADARELAEIIHIVSKSELKLCLPFYDIKNLIFETIINKFNENYFYVYRFNRGDNTLLNYLIKHFVSFIYKIHTLILNNFGYYQLDISIEKGDNSSTVVESKYFLQRKKIYSERYSTDAYSDFFRLKTLHSIYGLNDIPIYNSKTATFEEMSIQNSRFFNDMKKSFEVEVNNDDIIEDLISDDFI